MYLSEKTTDCELDNGRRKAKPQQAGDKAKTEKGVFEGFH